MISESPHLGVPNLRLALSALLGIALALALARLIMQGRVALPVCGWRWLTGLPCPFCGGVRCLDAASHGNFHRSLALNPLVFLGLTGGLAWTLISRLRHFLQTHAPVHWVRWLAMVVLINWIYLIAIFR
jgi:hypothetical protein